MASEDNGLYMTFENEDESAKNGVEHEQPHNNTTTQTLKTLKSLHQERRRQNEPGVAKGYNRAHSNEDSPKQWRDADNEEKNKIEHRLVVDCNTLPFLKVEK